MVKNNVCFSQYGFIGSLLDHSGFSYENTWSYVTSIQWYKSPGHGSTSSVSQVISKVQQLKPDLIRNSNCFRN